MSEFFLQGLLHPVFMPAHLILLLALGLLAGQQGAGAVKIVGGILLLSLALACGSTLQWRLRIELEISLLLSAMLIGSLVILRLELPRWPLLLLALLTGVLIGLDSAAPRIPGLRGAKVYALLAGTTLSSCVISLICGLFALMVRNLLEGIVIRVLGAWITAGAVLVLALYFVRDRLA
ncbi:MAG: HupE/UreJ family protein [Thiolinea sp.]